MDLGFKDQTLGVHEQVTLLGPLTFLAPSYPLSSSYAGALDRLALHHACARLGIELVAHPHTTAQGGVYLVPDTVYPPGPEVVVHRLPGREVVGQQSPGAPATHDDVEDGIEDLAWGV